MTTGHEGWVGFLCDLLTFELIFPNVSLVPSAALPAVSLTVV
jgi:hypothetical protein